MPLGRAAIYAPIDCGSSGDNTIVAAHANKKIRVLAVALVAQGNVDVRFEDGAGGSALTGQMTLVADGSSLVLPFSPEGWFEGTKNVLLNLELSGAVNVDGCIVYSLM